MSALTTTVVTPELKYMPFYVWSTPYYGTMQSNVTMDMDDLLFASNTTTQATNDEENIFYCPFMKSPISNLILMLLYAMVCLIGLFGNTLVIYVVFRFSKMQTVTNLYLINLAIADELFLIGMPFLINTMYLGEWIFGSFACKAYMVSTSITQFTSSIFLLIMSADRYLAVCHPISSPKFRTPFVAKIVAIIAWTTSAVFMLPVMLYSNTIGRSSNEDEKKSCIIKWPHSDSQSQLPFNGTFGLLEELEDSDNSTTFILYSLVMGFAIPLSLISCFYAMVLRKLRNVGPKSKSREKRRSHRKVTKLVLTVITVYILCWSPYWATQIANLTIPPEHCKTKLEIAVFVLVGCLVYSNSAMNPILYALMSDNFKKSFMKACSCAKGQDINAQLQIENSFFPKFTRNRGSERGGTFAATMTKLTHIDRKLSKNGDNVTTVLINNNTSSSNGKESPAAMSTFYSQQHERQATVLHTDL